MQKHILILEDDVDINDLLKIILETIGYRTTRHLITLEPEDIVRENVDLIIMDIRLIGSKYNGDQLCHLLKSEYPAFKTPVLLISAELKGKILARESGADGFLQKPFDIDELLSKISEMVA